MPYHWRFSKWKNKFRKDIENSIKNIWNTWTKMPRNHQWEIGGFRKSISPFKCFDKLGLSCAKLSTDFAKCYLNWRKKVLLQNIDQGQVIGYLYGSVKNFWSKCSSYLLKKDLDCKKLIKFGSKDDD